MPIECRARMHFESVLHPQASRHGKLIPCHGISALHRRSRRAASLALARTLWLQGYAERAVKVAQQTLDEAGTAAPPSNLFNCLILAGGVFLWIGDLPAAEAVIERLYAQAEEPSPAPHHPARGRPQ